MKSFGVGRREGYDSSPFYDRNIMQMQSMEHIKKEPDVDLRDGYITDMIYRTSSEDMFQLPDRCIDLVVTSPPYNVGKDYDDDLTLDEYLKLLTRVFIECHRVLVHGGRMCINVANLGRRPYLPLTSFITDIVSAIGFLNRGQIIWDKGAGAGSSCAWGSWCSASNPVLRDTHEYILVFSKDAYKKDRRLFTDTDMTKEEFLEWTKSVWSFQPESAKRVGHPAPFPVELPRRCIKMYSFTNEVILDPFMGSGTTAVAAIENNRLFMGYETNDEYFNLAKKRIDKAYEEKRRANLL